MRRLIAFPCAGAELAGSLDGAGGATGLLLVVGGSQTRIGSHRMYERLAKSLAEHNYPCLRYDRRGVGDSSGEDPGFAGSGPDLGAATAAFRAECPALTRLVGFGLCDGATALALFGDQAGLDAMILVNPWLVEAEAGSPPPAAIRQHYRQRLLSFAGWKKILTGAVDYRKLWAGVRKVFGGRKAASLSQDVARALLRHRLPAETIMCVGDATAIAADAEIRSWPYDGLILATQAIDTDSHTFARPGDDAMLLTAVLSALEEMEPEPGGAP